MLSASQRTSYLRLSKGEPIAWHFGGPFVAVASAFRSDDFGRTSRYTLIRTSADRAAVRRYFDQVLPRLEWGRVGAGDEEAGAARYRARFLDERTVEIGRFPVMDRVGAEARCLSLASRHPDAFEVASWRGSEGLPRALAAASPGRVDYHAHTDGRRATMTVVITAREALDLFDIRATERMVGFGLMPLSILAESRDERVEGRRLIRSSRVLWEDLMLAAEDERRINAAVSRDLRNRGPRPADEVDVRELGVVHEQRMLWESQLDAGGARGARARRELDRLLVRAIEAHPREAELRAQLFDLLARHVGDAGRAEEVATRAISDGVGDAAIFRQLRREAIARQDAGRLAEALAEDGVVPRPRARRAAEALVTAVGEGVDYAFAEGAWTAGRALVRRCYGARARRVSPVALDLAATIETLGALADAGDVGGALWVSVEGNRPSWRVARFDAEHAPRIALDVGRDVLIGAASTSGDPRLAALGSALADSIAPGPVVLSFIVVPFGGDASQPVAWGRMEGELADDRFTIERIAGPGARVDWARVKRYLTDPITSTEGRVFPEPDLSIEADSESDVRAIMALSDLHPFVLCRGRELVVGCQAAPGHGGALHDFAVELASELLVDAARTLTARANRPD